MLKLLVSIPNKMVSVVLSGQWAERHCHVKQRSVSGTMMIKHSYRNGLLSFILLSCFIVANVLPVLTLAQDTEIFLSPSNNAKHNVLFILDLSESMNLSIPGTVGPGGVGSRTGVGILREVLIDIVRGLDNLQVGFMRMNGSPRIQETQVLTNLLNGISYPCTPDILAVRRDARNIELPSSGGGITLLCSTGQEGGTVLFPVTDLDSEVLAEEIVISASVVSGHDDIDQNDINLGRSDSPSLNMGRQAVYLRFENVSIPQGAQVISAFVDFVAADHADNATDVDSGQSILIDADRQNNSPSFSARPVSARTFTTRNEPWSQIGRWTEDDRYSTPDIQRVIRAIVNRPRWCGGNALTLRFRENVAISRYAQSFESNSARAPVLRINYRDNYDADGTGCLVREFDIPVAASNRDAHAVVTSQGNSYETFIAATPIPFADSPNLFHYGVQFSLPVAFDTMITSATLQIMLDSNNPGEPGGVGIELRMENDLNPVPFGSGGSTRIDTRSNIIPLVDYTWNDLQSIDINVTDLVQGQVKKPGWQVDNTISFILVGISSTGGIRNIASFEGGPSQATRLSLSAQVNATNTNLTVRDALIEIARGISATSVLYSTPSVGTLYEAALYWQGNSVVFGSLRGSALLGRQIFPGSGPTGEVLEIDYSLAMERTLTSHPDSWTGGTYEPPTGVPLTTSCQRANTPLCVQDRIVGSPRYISPIDGADAECAANFQIFMTDGVPTIAPGDLFIQKITDDFNLDSCTTDRSLNEAQELGQCAVEMLREIRVNDQNENVRGSQTVTTHVISFAVDSGDIDGELWLQQLARAGGGNFYNTNTAAELRSAFNEILDTIIMTPSTFSAPAISANAFNRLFSRDEIYFGLFEAARTAIWDGNVKKYNICDRTDLDGDGRADCVLGNILDKDNKLAVEDGVFVSDTISVWSNEQDGGQLRVGGAGGEISDIDDRTIYTDLNNDGDTTSGPLSAEGYKLTSENWDSDALRRFRAEICPTSSIFGGPDCERRMLWLLGQDALDEDADFDTSELRWWFSDVLHSSPVAVTYGRDDKNTPQTDDDEFIDRIIVGTNDGMVHMINGSSGIEEWAFIPDKLLSNFQILYDNSQSQHLYGMDLTPVVQFVDANNNGVIEPPEDKAYVYLGMRRGGRNYYALDITPSSTLTSVNDTVVPKLLWQIEGGSGSSSADDFRRLAQTWSEPVVTNILCKINTDCPSGNKTVLIFGGGYDGRLDKDFAADIIPNIGNAIYVVDADSGKIIFWISHDEVDDGVTNVDQSAADIKVPDMLYSIMSQVTVLDSDGDSFDDRIYVGDAGGQVWRVDLGNDIEIGGAESDRPGSTVVGKLANISTTGSTSAQRRFHYKPAVVQVVDTVYSNAAGGEFDYVVIASGDRANPLDTNVRDRLYAFRDLTTTRMNGDGNGRAVGYPTGASNNEFITEGDMVDVTTRLLDSSESGDISALGWYYSFDIEGAGTGQKGLSAPIIIAGNVLVTSYLPAEADDIPACSAAEGTGVSHNFSILNAAATQNWDGEEPVDPIAHRSSALGAGIPSEVIPIFTREGVTLSVGTGRGPENLGALTGLPRFRTYWSEEEYSF